MAANANALRAGKAFVEFSLKDGAVGKQLDALEKRFAAIGSAFAKVGGAATAAGAAIVTAFTGAAAVFATAGSALLDMSNRTGVAVEDLGELGFVAKQAGSSMEELESSLRSMSKFLGKVRSGTKSAISVLAELSLASSDVLGRPPGEQWEILAKALAGVEDPTEQAAIAMKVFGKAGAGLLPIIREGPEALAHMREEAVRLGLVMSTEEATAADALGDALDILWAQLNRLSQVIGYSVAETFTQLLTMTQEILAQIIDWVSENRALLQSVLLFGVGLFLLGTALVKVGLAFHFIGLAVGGLSMGLGAVGSFAAAALSPFGLLTAAVLAGVAAFALYTEAGQTMVTNLVTWFGELNSIAVETFSAIGDALTAGDISLAAEVLWSALRLVWLQGTQSLRETWYSFTAAIAKAWHIAWAGMVQLVNVVSGTLHRSWSYSAEFLAQVFDTAGTNLANFWTRLVTVWQRDLNMFIGWFEKAWAYITGASDTELARISAEIADADRILRDERDKTINGRNAAAADRAAERAAAGAADRNASRATQDAVLEQIGSDLDRNMQGANDASRTQTEAAQKSLDAARAAWNDARNAAAAVGDAARSQKLSAGKKAADVAANASKADNKLASQGTFSAQAAVLMFSGGGWENELLAVNKAQLEEQRIANRKKTELPRGT